MGWGRGVKKCAQSAWGYYGTNCVLIAFSLRQVLVEVG